MVRMGGVQDTNGGDSAGFGTWLHAHSETALPADITSRQPLGEVRLLAASVNSPSDHQHSETR